MYLEAKSGPGDDFMPGGPAVRVTRAADGSVAFVDQVRGSALPPGVTAQQLQTMKTQVMVAGGLIMFAMVGAPVALLARLVAGWGWAHSLLLGAGAGAAGGGWWVWRVDSAAADLSASAPAISQPVTATPPVQATSPLGAPVTATPPSLATASQTTPGYSLATAMPSAPPTTVTYKNVVITLTPPPPPPPPQPAAQPGMSAIWTVAQVWTASFTLPSIGPQALAATTPAAALSAAQAAIDAALATPFVSPTSIASMLVQGPAAAAAAAPSYGSMKIIPAAQPAAAPHQLMSPITYRGVAVAFTYTGGAVTASMKLPGNFVVTSIPAQASYAAAVTAAKAAIDGAYAQASLPSPL
jgi:hypothetical protein